MMVEDKECLAYWLTQASQETIYIWLEKNKPEKNHSKDYDRLYIENELIKRKDPLVQLGLARFGHVKETGIELYKKEDDF